MNDIDQLFFNLRSRQAKALMPFFAAGDPDIGMTLELLRSLQEAGCHLCELGFPYSDPIADGPTIQAAFTRALNGGFKVDDLLLALSHRANQSKIQEPSQVVGGQNPGMPQVAMLSYAIVHRMGVSRFVGRIAEAGFSGLIVPDLPGEESVGLADLCRSKNLSLVQLITPTTRPERARRIIAVASGFIYYVSVAGVTGSRTELPPEIADNLQALRRLTELPICVGFGISGPDQVRQLAPHCDGVIVGSAIVRRLESGLENGHSPAQICGDIASFCTELLQALNGS